MSILKIKNKKSQNVPDIFEIKTKSSKGKSLYYVINHFEDGHLPTHLQFNLSSRHHWKCFQQRPPTHLETSIRQQYLTLSTTKKQTFVPKTSGSNKKVEKPACLFCAQSFVGSDSLGKTQDTFGYNKTKTKLLKKKGFTFILFKPVDTIVFQQKKTRPSLHCVDLRKMAKKKKSFSLGTLFCF